VVINPQITQISQIWNKVAGYKGIIKHLYQESLNLRNLWIAYDSL
jgi:hypothetical protein